MKVFLKKAAVALWLVLAVLAAQPARADDAAAAKPKTIMFIGDSITAGLGLKFDEALPAQLEMRLKKEGLNVSVINAGVSGDTTADGLRRLEYSLKQKPDYVILALGANDMLNNVNPVTTRENLRQMLETLKAHDLPVLLVGMQAFSNLGPDMAMAYLNMYKMLADKYETVFYPFLLKGVALDPNLNQQDGIHPNAAGVAVIVDNILPSVADLLVAQKAAPAPPPQVFAADPKKTAAAQKPATTPKAK